jgi:hypothetical protein
MKIKKKYLFVFFFILVNLKINNTQIHIIYLNLQLFITPSKFKIKNNNLFAFRTNKQIN